MDGGRQRKEEEEKAAKIRERWEENFNANQENQ